MVIAEDYGRACRRNVNTHLCVALQRTQEDGAAATVKIMKILILMPMLVL